MDDKKIEEVAKVYMIVSFMIGMKPNGITLSLMKKNVINVL